MGNQDEIKAILRRVQSSDRRSRTPEKVAAELKQHINTFALEMAEKAQGSPLSPEADAGVTGVINKIDDHIKMVFWGMSIQVASSDGPINEHEARFMKLVFDRNISAAVYGKIDLPPKSEAENFYAEIISAVLQINMHNSPDIENYEPQHDPVFKTIDLIGDAIMNADESVNLKEAASFAVFTSIAHQKAIDLKQRIRTVFEKDVPAAIPPTTHLPVQPASEELTPLEQCVDELHSLVGLESVKKEVETLINIAKIFAHRREKGMPIPPLSFHLVLTGNPGTGKTTVARIIAKVYGALGHLKTNRVVEVDRSGLVGNYIGQTANKTKRVVESALGGVLFIDEAYSLARSYENDFGSEAIEVILKAMEDHREDLVVIVAGYADRMVKFISSNPGLKSRFSRTIDFPDYSAADMVVIFEQLAKRNGYLIDDDARSVLTQTMNTRWLERGPDFANARDVRSMFEQAVSAQANRIATLATIDEHALATLTHEDLAT